MIKNSLIAKLIPERSPPLAIRNAGLDCDENMLQLIDAERGLIDWGLRLIENARQSVGNPWLMPAENPH